MLPTEGTDGVDDLVDLLQGLSVHGPVELLEVSFDGCVIEAAGFVIGIEQHRQDASSIVGIVWLLCGQMESWSVINSFIFIIKTLLIR